MPGRLPNALVQIHYPKRAINCMRGPRRSWRLGARARGCAVTYFRNTDDWLTVAPMHAPTLFPDEKREVSERLTKALLVVTRRKQLDNSKQMSKAFCAAYRRAIIDGLADIHGRYNVPDTHLDVVCRVATSTIITFGHRVSVKMVTDIMADGNRSPDIRLMHHWNYGTNKAACRVIKSRIPSGYLQSDYW